LRVHVCEFRFCGLEEYRSVRSLVAEYLQQQLKTGATRMEIALNEAINNAIFHGADGGTVTVRLALVGGRLVARVRNEGEGFTALGQWKLQTASEDEMDLLDEHGRGLLIMSAMADRVLYNRTGTEVMLVKKLS
jgi:serine/threonine-protein kinase RsbW